MKHKYAVRKILIELFGNEICQWDDQVKEACKLLQETVTDKWKPKEMEEIYYVAGDGNVIQSKYSSNDSYSNMGNYFKTKSEAIEASKQVKELFKRLKKQQ